MHSGRVAEPQLWGRDIEKAAVRAGLPANVARVLLEAMRFAEEPQVAELRAEAESLRALIAHQGRLA